MRNPESWKPSKFIRVDGGWAASPDTAELGRGSRLIGAIQAETYARAIAVHAKGRLLDLGCGKVPLYGMYKHLVVEAVCVDWENSLHENDHVDYFLDLNHHADRRHHPPAGFERRRDRLCVRSLSRPPAPVAPRVGSRRRSSWRGLGHSLDHQGPPRCSDGRAACRTCSARLAVPAQSRRRRLGSARPPRARASLST